MDEAAFARAREWVGRTDEADDIVTPRLVDSYKAMFAPNLFGGEEAPLGLHWCLAPEIIDTPLLKADGHAPHGGFWPPTPLPRRMWAAGSTEFLAPLLPGDSVRRRAEITGVDLKRGRSGALLFVTMTYDFSTARGLAIREERSIVFRDMGGGASPSPPPGAAEFSRTVDPSTPLLLRYSALSFNAHRIHYDRDYTTKIERYPGLVVQGPLQASLALNAAALLGGKAPARFQYRAQAPLFDDAPFQVCARRDGTTIAAWTQNAAGGVAFLGSAT